MSESTQTGDPAAKGARPTELSGNLGTTSLVLSVLAFSAPLVTVAGYMVFVIGPVGESAPVAWIVATMALLIFAVGYTTMTRYVPRPGAFYAYISLAFGRVPGVGAAYLAATSYIVIAAGLYVFAGLTISDLVAGLFGAETPWWLWTTVSWLAVNTLAYRNVDLSAKVLVVVMAFEVIIVSVFDLFTLAQGGAQGLSAAPFNPMSFINPGAGVALLIAFGTFLGFEATALFRDEVRNPNKTVPRATYTAALFIGGLYTASCYALVTAYGSAAADTANSDPSGTFAGAFDRFVAHGLSPYVGIVVATSAVASLLAIHNVATRYVFNLGVDGALPTFVGKVNPHQKAPSRASIAVGTTMAVLLLAFGIPFAVAHADPSVLIGAGSGLGSAGVLLLMAIVSLVVVVWFKRSGTPPQENIWKVRIAPAIAFLLLAAIVTFGLVRFDLMVGGAPGQYSWLLLILVGFFVIGCLVAAHLKKRRPDVYARLGRRDRAIVDIASDEQNSTERK